MLKGCFMIGVILTSQCTIEEKHYATDRERCKNVNGRIKAPRIVHKP